MTRNTRARRWCISMLTPSLSVAASPTLSENSIKTYPGKPRHRRTARTSAVRKYECSRIRATGGGTTRSSVCISEMACDADYEYAGDCGSVSAVEDLTNSVIND